MGTQNNPNATFAACMTLPRIFAEKMILFSFKQTDKKNKTTPYIGRKQRNFW
ncbi:hypothetical protein AA106555_1586 [Neokomagataea thailandica NBRC 106555]|uniref:Uncharacterized protein n=1 Tax=Neokomagataea thailandica NBRC 106555 TaxID=1223520 RepID=A0ABQ0QRE4_9PROT|nr:hypothetical protein AA106555_1586 [Neokomagataea thailandica NBRC 106555]